MTKYIYIALLLILASCSSGLSDSEALKIAKDTPGFQTAEYALLRINQVNAATSDSRYIVEGVQVEKRDKGDDEIHHTGYDGFIPLKYKDADGKVVCIAGNKYLLSWRNIFGGSCAGCEYCYTKFKEMGLVNIQVVDNEPDSYGFKKFNVTLTDEGKKYVINWEDANAGNALVSNLLYANTGDAVAVKLMERVYTGAKKVKETETEAVFYLQYYLDLTPFGEVLVGKIPQKPGFQSIATYKKTYDDKWELVSLEDIRLNGDKREFPL